jgi:hypothetical protein
MHIGLVCTILKSLWTFDKQNRRSPQSASRADGKRESHMQARTFQVGMHGLRPASEAERRNRLLFYRKSAGLGKLRVKSTFRSFGKLSLRCRKRCWRCPRHPQQSFCGDRDHQWRRVYGPLGALNAQQIRSKLGQRAHDSGFHGPVGICWLSCDGRFFEWRNSQPWV